MSDPTKSYHLEIVCDAGRTAQSYSEDSDEQLWIPMRRSCSGSGCHVVYLKEGYQIVDMLNVMEAHVALLELENVRILKEMRNAVNRKVNCETANINKTVSAAVRQMEDIAYIRDTIGFDRIAGWVERRRPYTSGISGCSTEGAGKSVT